MNKHQVYKSFGIDYKAGKILYNGEYIPELLVDGNSKLGKGVWTWSMLPGNIEHTVTYNGRTITAMGTCNCNCAGCYAQTGFYNMPNTKYSNALKTIIARNSLEFMKNAIIAQIHASGIKLVRIHASGDFFSVDYIHSWQEIAIACPDCILWTYTKNHIAEGAFDHISNVNVVKSMIPGFGFNFGHCDYIMAMYDSLKSAGKSVHVCKCGFDKNQHCVNCKGCSENEYVLFVEHSTSYKAESDECFPVLKKIAMERGE